MAEIVRCVWCIWAVWWFPDEETPRFGLWEPRILWVRFLSSTREAWSSLAVIKSPLRHKPHSCFGVPRVDQSQSQSGLQIALGGGGESGSRSKRRASDWTPGRVARSDWPSQLEAEAMAFFSCCERSSRVRDSSSRSWQVLHTRTGSYSCWSGMGSFSWQHSLQNTFPQFLREIKYKL